MNLSQRIRKAALGSLGVVCYFVGHRMHWAIDPDTVGMSTSGGEHGKCSRCGRTGFYRLFRWGNTL